MKNLKFIIALIILSFVIVQCTKENTNEITGENINLRSELDCHAEGHPNGECYVVPSYSIEIDIIDPVALGIPLSVIGDCKISAIYDITICVSPLNNNILSFEFDNFKMNIPDNTDCTQLRTWLDNLKVNDPVLYDDIYNDLSNYVAENSKFNFMDIMITNNYNIEFPLETKTYLVKCYQKRVMSQLIPIYSLSSSSNPKDWEIIGYEEKEVVSFTRCGVGCCIDRTTYFKNKNGDIDKTTSIYSVGACEQINGNGLKDSDNKIELRGGDNGGTGCYQRCI